MPTGEAYIRLMSGGERGKGWELTPGQSYTLGRSRQCHVHVPDPTVSANHAKLECRGETWFVIDLESSHGTRVNRERIEGEQPLFDRDLVWIGRTVLEFRQYEQLAPEDLAEIDRGVQPADAPATE